MDLGSRTQCSAVRLQELTPGWSLLLLKPSSVVPVGPAGASCSGQSLANSKPLFWGGKTFWGSKEQLKGCCVDTVQGSSLGCPGPLGAGSPAPGYWSLTGTGSWNLEQGKPRTPDPAQGPPPRLPRHQPDLPLPLAHTQMHTPLCSHIQQCTHTFLHHIHTYILAYVLTLSHIHRLLHVHSHKLTIRVFTHMHTLEAVRDGGHGGCPGLHDPGGRSQRLPSSVAQGHLSPVSGEPEPQGTPAM